MQDQNNQQNEQIQQGFMMRNYKNIGLLILLCLFILFLVVIFYFVIYLIYEADAEISSTFQYEITEYAATDTTISIIAHCIDCLTYYINKNNYLANYLNITIVFFSPAHLNLQIKGLDFPYQFEVPHKLPFSDYQSAIANNSLSYKEYDIALVYSPMRIIVTRTQTNETLFDTMDFRLVYSRFYIEITTKLPSQNLFGLGEQNELFSLRNGSFSTWNRMPRFNASNDTESWNYSSNTFGSQPIYLVREESGYYYTVFLRNFDAMDLVFNGSLDDATLQFRLVNKNNLFIFNWK